MPSANLRVLPPTAQVMIDSERKAEHTTWSKDRKRLYAAHDEELHVQVKPGEPFRVVHLFKDKIARLSDTFINDQGVEILAVTIAGRENPSGHSRQPNRLRFFELVPLKQCLRDVHHRTATLVVRDMGWREIDGLCIGFDISTRQIMIQTSEKDKRIRKESADDYWIAVMAGPEIDEEEPEPMPQRSSREEPTVERKRRSNSNARLRSVPA